MTDRLTPEDLPPLAGIVRNYINLVLTATKGNRTKAARILGISPRTLYSHIQRHPELARWRRRRYD